MSCYTPHPGKPLPDDLILIEEERAVQRRTVYCLALGLISLVLLILILMH